MNQQEGTSQETLDAANSLLFLSGSVNTETMNRQEGTSQETLDAANSLLFLSGSVNTETMNRHEEVSQETIDAANTLLMLSRAVVKHSNEDVEAAHALLLLSGQTPLEEPPAECDFEKSLVSFEEFRQNALDEQRQASGGELVKSNPKMKRQIRGSNAPDEEESTDLSLYLDLREKNNKSSKKSRDGRRISLIENQIKVDFYEIENVKYADELTRVLTEIETVKEKLVKKRTNRDDKLTEG